MDATQIQKTDFIKFNVSPEFKSLAEKKAAEHGMTISELGRMLFGAFVTGMAKPSITVSPELILMAKQAQENHKKGLGTLVKNKKELEDYLNTL